MSLLFFLIRIKKTILRKFFQLLRLITTFITPKNSAMRYFYFKLLSINNYVLYYFGDLEGQRKKIRILIYSTGKVGSSTITRTLRKYKFLVYHVHQLRFEQMYTSRNQRLDYWYARYLRKKLIQTSNPKKWKIVTFVREPVGRNVSLFFQLWFNNHIFKKHVIEKTRDFFSNLKNPYHNLYVNWFDTELKFIFGIDVYSVDFNKSKGYKIYKGKGHPDLLLIRQENITGCATEAFKEFLGIENFTLQNTNLTKKKSYGKLYQKFKSSNILPKSYIEKMYASKYTQHFYTKKEVNTFKKKWS